MKNNNLSHIDAIIFDLDGTLWNSSSICLQAWNHVLNTIDCVKAPISKYELESIFGMQHDLIGKKLFPHLTKTQADEVMEHCFHNEMEMIKKYGGELFENVESVLDILSNKYQLFIVSNCQKGYIEAFYEFHKLDHFFKDYECSGNTGLPKATNIKLIIERNQLKNPLYIGDTLGDYDAARINMIPFIYAEYGFGNIPNVDIKIDRFDRIIDLL